jgi:type I restriction enzyme R subunit
VIGEIVIGYTEDHLVEHPAIELLAQLGWATISAKEEVLGPSGTLGRENKSEVVLVPRLRIALERLNPTLPAEAISFAIDKLARDRSAMSLAAANREIWEAQQVKVLIQNHRHRPSVDVQPTWHY